MKTHWHMVKGEWHDRYHPDVYRPRDGAKTSKKEQKK